MKPLIRTLALGSTLLFAAACSPTDGAADTATPAGEQSLADTSSSSTLVGEPTPEALSRYPLDMGKMRKWALTMQYLAAAVRADTTLADQTGLDGGSLQESITRIEQTPAINAAVRKAGWSARDYVFTTTAWLQAAMMDGALSASTDAKLPAGHSRQNIDFLRAHRAELEQMQKSMAPLSNGGT